MSIKTKVKAVKAKKAVKEAKDSLIELAKEIKVVTIQLNLEDKKHKIEIDTK